MMLRLFIISLYLSISKNYDSLTCENILTYQKLWKHVLPPANDFYIYSFHKTMKLKTSLKIVFTLKNHKNTLRYLLRKSLWTSHWYILFVVQRNRTKRSNHTAKMSLTPILPISFLFISPRAFSVALILQCDVFIMNITYNLRSNYSIDLFKMALSQHTLREE